MAILIGIILGVVAGIWGATLLHALLTLIAVLVLIISVTKSRNAEIGSIYIFPFILGSILCIVSLWITVCIVTPPEWLTTFLSGLVK